MGDRKSYSVTCVSLWCYSVETCDLNSHVDMKLANDMPNKYRKLTFFGIL